MKTSSVQIDEVIGFAISWLPSDVNELFIAMIVMKNPSVKVTKSKVPEHWLVRFKQLIC